MRPSRPVDWLSLLQFTFSGLVLVSLAGLALALASSAFIGLLDGSSGIDQNIALLSRAAGFGLAAVLTLPSVGLALMRLLSRPAPAIKGLPDTSRLPFRIISLAAMALTWVLAIFLIAWAGKQNGGLAFLQPLLYLAAGGLPIAFLILLGVGGLPAGSAQRRWGALTAGMAGTTMIIIVIELLVFIGVALAAGIAIASQPEWLAELTRIAERLSSAQQLNTETLQRILRPILEQPWVTYLVVALVSGAVPLIEELLKPLPLWLFARKNLTPAEGFSLGLICGAGFAFFESMSMLSTVSGDAWIAIGVGRAGTDLLHITNAGLMGWALASTWRDGRYLRVAAIYLLVCGLHGLWNVFSLAQGILPLVGPVNGLPLSWLQQPAVVNAGLVAISVILLIFLLVFRRKVQPQRGAASFGTTEVSGG